eukprot:767948-Hanusia_phi.AAC.5
MADAVRCWLAQGRSGTEHLRGARRILPGISLSAESATCPGHDGAGRTDNRHARCGVLQEARGGQGSSLHSPFPVLPQHAERGQKPLALLKGLDRSHSQGSRWSSIPAVPQVVEDVSADADRIRTESLRDGEEAGGRDRPALAPELEPHGLRKSPPNFCGRTFRFGAPGVDCLEGDGDGQNDVGDLLQRKHHPPHLHHRPHLGAPGRSGVQVYDGSLDLDHTSDAELSLNRFQRTGGLRRQHSQQKHSQPSPLRARQSLDVHVDRVRGIQEARGNEQG